MRPFGFQTISIERLIRQSSYFVLFVSVMLAVWYQSRILEYIEWGDESETIVAAKMLAAGMSLYSEVFNHHGPLTFITGYILELFGNFGVKEHRVPIAILQWFAIISVYLSPLLKNASAKNIFIAIAIFAIVVLLPENSLFGHAYIYQVIAGIFVVVIISQLTIPVIIDHKLVTPLGGAIGYILIASLPFLAVSYLPAAGLLYLSSVRTDTIKKSVIYLIFGLILNLVFLGLIGSFKGYLAYHIYLNAEILPLYNGGQGLFKLVKNVLSALSGSIEGFISFVGLILVLSILIAKEGKRLPWRSLFLAIAIFSLLMRGNIYHGVPFWYSCIALITIIASQQKLSVQQKLLWVLFTFICILRTAYPLIIDPDLLSSKRRPESTEFGDLAKSITDKDDRIIAYSFQNFEYIAADRLPASGHFFYLPWQEKYNETPKFGIEINACVEIDKYRPKIMLIDKWVVWGKYGWNTYADCIQSLLDQNYSQIPDRPYYIRNDLFEKAIGLYRQK